jgi:hypothetical protein
MNYDCKGKIKPKVISANICLENRNLRSVNANAAIEPKSSTADVQVPVTIALFIAYFPNPPTENASANTEKSHEVGSDIGFLAISALLLSADIAIQSNGTK